jgi:putative membrane protein
MTTLFAFLHHLAAFTLVAAVAIQLVLLRMEFTLGVAKRLQIADRILGVSATILLIVGLMRVFYFEKGPDYYWSSHAFLAKFSLFVLAAVLSIVPTVVYLSWGRAIRDGLVPEIASGKLRSLRLIVHAELACIVLILLFAAIMARGGWV